MGESSGVMGDTSLKMVVSGGSFLACKDFRGQFDSSFLACVFCFFFKWRSAHKFLFLFFGFLVGISPQ